MTAAERDSLELAREMQTIALAARHAAGLLARAEPSQKTAALRYAAQAVRDARSAILAANAEDMAAAEQIPLSAALLDRLRLNERRIEAMAEGLETVAALPDPAGTELARWTQPNGLDIARVRIPIGVIGIIYESRPNVTADAGGLCLRAGNVAILRCGSESLARRARSKLACTPASPPPASPRLWCSSFRRGTEPPSGSCSAWRASST